jgi:hypothetical protein
MIFGGAALWCVLSIDKSFDSMSEDYISSAALQALKKHNTTEAAELLLRFHLEHSGKMSAEHLSQLGQCLTMRAEEAIQSKEYSTALDYLGKISNDCPQYAGAQAKLKDLKERGLTTTAAPSPAGGAINPANVPIVSPSAAPALVAGTPCATPASSTISDKAPDSASGLQQSELSSSNSPANDSATASSWTNDIGADAIKEAGAFPDKIPERKQNSSLLQTKSIAETTAVPPAVTAKDNSATNEKLQSTLPIWQRFSRGAAIVKTRSNDIAGHSGVMTNSANANINENGIDIRSGSGGGSSNGVTSSTTNGTKTDNNHSINVTSANSEANRPARATVSGNAELDPAEESNIASTSAIGHGGGTSGSERAPADAERSRAKVSGFFIDGKEITHDSRLEESEKNPEIATESGRKAGPKSRQADGQKSYNPDDISRYNELLAAYFGQHDVSSPKPADKHSNGSEPPSFQEWISKGKPGFR